MQKLIIALLALLTFAQTAHAQVGLFIRPNSSSLSAPVSGQTWFFNSSNNTVSVWNGSSFQLASQPQNNFSATIAPTVHNDSTQGYGQGSIWYNTTNQSIFNCVSAAINTAVWIQVTSNGGSAIPLGSLSQGGATSGQSLVWNGSAWAPAAPVSTLSQLTQSGAITGQTIAWNGSHWAPTNIVPLTVQTPTSPYTTGTYTLTGSENSVLPVDAGASTVTFNLPLTSSVPNKIYYFVVTNAHSGFSGDPTIILNTASGDFIQGQNNSQTTITLQSPQSGLAFISDGNGNWYGLHPTFSRTEYSGDVYSLLMANNAGRIEWQSTSSSNNFSSVPVQYPAWLLMGSNTSGEPTWQWGLNGLNTTLYTDPSNLLTGNEPSVLLADTSAGNVGIQLPLAANTPFKVYVLSNTNGPNAISLSTSGSDTIETNSLMSISNIQQPVAIISDGTSIWHFLFQTPTITSSGSIQLSQTSGPSTVHIIGAFTSVVPETGNFNAMAGAAYQVNATTANCTLPDATTVTGQEILVQNVAAAGTITYLTTSSQLINGQSSGSITNAVQYKTNRFVSDGSNWILEF